MQNILPVLTNEEKGQIALHLITEEMVLEHNWFANPNSARRELIARAKCMNIEPNKLLALLQELLQPNLEALFKPISEKEVSDYETEREERRRQKEQQKQGASKK
ncbi:MAG: hypothetical protein KGJ35_00675 [Patescibacteria group bacterium]|nr:hypothetical protein [Patescibacteria group bacterium]